MSYGQVIFRGFEVIIYESACISETDIRNLFYIIFQTIDQACFYIQVVFI